MIETSNFKFKFNVKFIQTKYDVKINGKKSKERTLTGKQNSKEVGYPGTTNKRCRDDFQMDSPYNGTKYRRKNIKSNISITETQSNTKIEKIKSNKNNKKNDLKDSFVLENINFQDENTKFIPIAREMVENF